MANLTVDHLQQIMPNAPEGDIEEEFPHILETLRKFDINTKKRIAAFLANVAKESGEIFYTEEIADGWAYEGRADLGNVYPGDGPKFKGHGYIQITGRANHEKVAKGLGIDCVNNPLILTEVKWAWMSAGWYWKYGSSWGDLNKYADNNDFASTVLGVRGSSDPDRWRYWTKGLTVLPNDISLDSNDAINVEYDSEGWAYDKNSKLYIKAEPNIKLFTNKSGWLWKEVTPSPVKPDPVVGWDWPAGNAEPVPSSWNYAERCPTRYSWKKGGRSDVEGWARYLVDAYPGKIWCNTYHKHPEEVWINEGVSREYDSFDVWDYKGRGWPVNPGLGNEIFNLLFYYEGQPDIEWIIWRATIYGAWNGWKGEPFGSNEFSWHYDHIHVTYL